MHLVAFSSSDCVCNCLTVIVTDTLFTSLHSYFERDLLPKKEIKQTVNIKIKMLTFFLIFLQTSPQYRGHEDLIS